MWSSRAFSSFPSRPKRSNQRLERTGRQRVAFQLPPAVAACRSAAALYAYAVELTWLERREGVGNRRHQQLEDAMTLVKGTAVTAERNNWR